MRRVNEAGGINGRKINVLAEDNRFNAATDKIAFEKLVGQTPVIAISGMGSSGSQVALAPTIKAGKVPIVGTYTATKALSEPVSPMVYNGFCGYKQMAQAGVGYYADALKLRAPKVVTVAIESAGGMTTLPRPWPSTAVAPPTSRSRSPRWTQPPRCWRSWRRSLTSSRSTACRTPRS
jgi:branched-chain amino acid transport system substrate-binding protein